MKLKLAILIAALAVIAAACGESTDEGVATLSDTDVVVQEVEAAAVGAEEDALLAFAACMRDNGVPDFEDPVVNADGSVEFGRGPGESAFNDVDRDTMEGAFAACQTSLDGIAIGPGGGDMDMTELEDTMVEFASCMRDNGYEMDDPDLSSFGPGGNNEGESGEGGGPFGDFNQDDPQYQAAFEVCQDILAGFEPGGAGVGGGNG
ncbi:MAG: hypothetical protein ABFS21_11175 [Actinomycetota bacterium]